MFYRFLFNNESLIEVDCRVMQIGTVESNAIGGQRSTKLVVKTAIGLCFEPDISMSLELDYVAAPDSDFDTNNKLQLLECILNLDFTPDFLPYYASVKNTHISEDPELNTVGEFEVNMFCSEAPDSVNALKSEGVELRLVDEGVNSISMSREAMANSLLPNIELLLKGSARDNNGRVKLLEDVASEDRQEYISSVQEAVINDLRIKASRMVIRHIKTESNF